MVPRSNHLICRLYQGNVFSSFLHPVFKFDLVAIQEASMPENPLGSSIASWGFRMLHGYVG